MFAALNSNPTPISRDHHKKIPKLIQTLLAYDESNFFRKPVPHKSLGWEDYKNKIKKPIDLNYVRRQYGEGKYKFVEQVLDQIELIWDNVFTYGKRDHESYEMAIKMVKHFDEAVRDYFPQFADKVNRVNYFKQFEPVKTQKKSHGFSLVEKSNKKIEKMDVENVKEQNKNQKNLRGSSSTRRRQQIGLGRYQNQQHILPNAPLNIENPEVSKKKPETPHKNAQHKKSTSKVNQIDIQEPEAALQKEQIPNVEPLGHQNEENLENKQSKVAENLPNPEAFSIKSQMNQQMNVNPLVSQNLPQLLDAEDSQQNHFPPITVNLNKTPSSQEVAEITKFMSLLFELQEMQTISKIVKILTKYEKQNMIIDGQDVNFRMNEIHISTYSRIRKEIQDRMSQLERSQKHKELNRLKGKYDIKVSQKMDAQIINQQLENCKIVQEI